jgi:mono/diheme cytochrome c family protein
MNLFSRRICLTAVVTMSFLALSAYPALASDCMQKRKAPQAPSKIYKQTNPLAITPENISAGEKIYTKGAKPLACIQCHGASGSGNGKMASGMTPKPRDFSCQAMMKTIPDGQLFWVIQNGSKGTGMMGFKTLKDEQIWQVISYIRQFSN